MSSFAVCVCVIGGLKSLKERLGLSFGLRRRSSGRALMSQGVCESEPERERRTEIERVEKVGESEDSATSEQEANEGVIFGGGALVSLARRNGCARARSLERVLKPVRPDVHAWSERVLRRRGK